MIKTLLALSGAVLLAAPSLHAQHGGRSFGPAAGGSHFAPSAARGNLTAARRPFYGDAARHYRHGGGYRGRGHYYYYGGIPYFYDPFFFGSGYYGGYGYGFGSPYGYGYETAYEGRIVDERRDGDQPAAATASLPTAVQRQLAKRGYYKGSIDGQFGPASKSALSRFQRDNDLDETGRINEDTLKALGFEDHR